MTKNYYFMDIIYHLGFAINDKNNSETILNYHIKLALFIYWIYNKFMIYYI